MKLKDYSLNFGVRFVRELDKLDGLEIARSGVKQNFGMALAKVLPALQAYDSAILADVLYCASWDNEKRPSQKEIDGLVDGCDDIEKLFDDVEKALAESNAVKTASKNLKA